MALSLRKDIGTMKLDAAPNIAFKLRVGINSGECFSFQEKTPRASACLPVCFLYPVSFLSVCLYALLGSLSGFLPV